MNVATYTPHGDFELLPASEDGEKTILGSLMGLMKVMPQSPKIVPPPSRNPPSLSTIQRTDARPAPSAILTPISCVRWATV